MARDGAPGRVAVAGDRGHAKGGTEVRKGRGRAEGARTGGARGGARGEVPADATLGPYCTRAMASAACPACGHHKAPHAAAHLHEPLPADHPRMLIPELCRQMYNVGAALALRCIALSRVSLQAG